jgi:hypothetical protein
MNIVVMAAMLALVPMGAALLYLFRTLSSRQNPDLSPGLVLPSWKYRPMARLLQEEDFRFLSAQAGYSPRLGRRLRAERRRIFRAYLRALRKDFARVSLELRTLILHSADDRSEDLTAALVRRRVKFHIRILAIQGSLLLHWAGVRVTVDVSGMVEALTTMQTQMCHLLTPLQAGSKAE